MNNCIFLTSTDTTIGFISKNQEKLSKIKKRKEGKRYIIALSSLALLNKFTRTPLKSKKRVRRAKKTTFIFPNKRSFRVIKDESHLLLIKRLEWAYTTSANISGKEFDLEFAINSADIIIKPLIYSPNPSKILQIGKKRAKKIR